MPTTVIVRALFLAALAVSWSALPLAAESSAPALVAAGRIELAGPLLAPRATHSTTLLATGEVLIVGGCTEASCEAGDASATTELYDPSADRFLPTGAMDEARYKIVDAVVLAGDHVVVAGGGRTVEVFDEGEGALGSPAATMTVSTRPQR